MRRILLQALILEPRLVFPPPEWLRNAYGLPPKRLLAPYYLLRPLRLVWHTLQDLFTRLFRRPSP